MSITKTLNDKDLTADAKLERVAETVAKARDNYGNADVEIKPGMVNTTHGSMSFTHVDDETRVAVLQAEVGFIKAKAVEFVNQTPGASINKKVEELIAINPFFTNIVGAEKFDYL